jgi:c(7)-type cytochrome triheme protein
MRALSLAILLVVAGLAAASPQPRWTADAPSPVVYPDQRLPLVFTHTAHARRGVTCVDCHAAAETSRSAVDDLLPPEAVCARCHPIDRNEPTKQVDGAPARCDACHLGYVEGAPPARVRIPPPNLKFSHAAHSSLATCEGCHGDLVSQGVAVATRDHLPRMRLCLECHDGVQAEEDCDLCHLAEVGVLRTDLAEGTLEPNGNVWGDAHDDDFLRNHGAVASRDEEYCGACHRQRFCSDCHTGVVKPADFHPGDYAMTHAVDARRNDPDCATCHRAQTFCVACHQRSGVGAGSTDDPDTQFEQDDPMRRFHPADWVSLADGGFNRHAREARANLTACASCHREDFCLECHTAEPGSRRISPHGAGWRGSARCEALATRNARMCLRCHTDPDEQGCDW